jgi:hypothetical protein
MYSGSRVLPARNANSRLEKGKDMTAYRFTNPASLYQMLDGIEAHIAVGEWGIAETEAKNVEDEARFQKSATSVALYRPSWRKFIDHADYLQVAIRGKDASGSVGELALLHATLSEVAGVQCKNIGDNEAD